MSAVPEVSPAPQSEWTNGRRSWMASSTMLLTDPLSGTPSPFHPEARGQSRRRRLSAPQQAVTKQVLGTHRRDSGGGQRRPRRSRSTARLSSCCRRSETARAPAQPCCSRLGPRRSDASCRSRDGCPTPRTRGPATALVLCRSIACRQRGRSEEGWRRSSRDRTTLRPEQQQINHPQQVSSRPWPVTTAERRVVGRCSLATHRMRARAPRTR